MKAIYLFISVFLMAVGYSQNSKISASLLNHLQLEADVFIGYDGIGDCFYQKNNIVYKKSSTKLFQYQNVALGKLTHVDIINPLKVILFYPEFNTVVLVDSQLNEIQTINFNESEIPITATAIGNAAQNQLWLFNLQDQHIGLFDTNTMTYKPIGSAMQELTYYQSNFNFFEWITSDNKWYSITPFGRIDYNGQLKAFDQVQFLDNRRVVIQKEQHLFLSDLVQNSWVEIEIVEKSFKNFCYKDQILSIFTDQGITNYNLTIP